MGRYRKIDTRIWNDAKFTTLTDKGKLAFFLLLTHPHMTGLGAMRASLPGLACDLGWSEKAFREAFAEAFRKALVRHDEKTCFVWLPKFLKYNTPESPNVVRSWGVQLDLLPECEMKNELVRQVKAFTEGFGKGFGKALPEAFRKALPYQEHEQEQEHKHEQEEEPSPSGDGLALPSKISQVAIPGILDTPEFREAWATWISFRSARKSKITVHTAIQQLKNLESWGLAKALESIRYSIGGGYQGLFDPDDRRSGGRQATRQGLDLTGLEF